MKKTALCGIATALTFACMGPAHAVPMYFDFTGMVGAGTLDTPFGAVISGGFSFETDRLLSAGPPASGIQYSFLDWNPTGLTQPLASLSFNGRDISYPLYGLTYAYVNFVDGCQPLCNTGWLENFSLNVITQDPWMPDYTGVLRTQYLSVSSSSQSPLPDFPYWQGFEYFDGAAMTPGDAITLPLHRLMGIFAETTSECVAGSCTTVSDSQFNFSVDDVSRGFGPRSVPEPGTLGLLGAGLLMASLTRRRRVVPGIAGEQQ